MSKQRTFHQQSKTVPSSKCALHAQKTILLRFDTEQVTVAVVLGLVASVVA